MKYIIYLSLLLILGACNKRSQCAAYQDVGAWGIPDENYEPSNYIIVQRDKKTGLVKKVDNVKKVKYTSRKQKSRIYLKNEKKYIKDKDIFPEIKAKKTKKKSKKKKDEEEAEPIQKLEPEESTPKDTLK
ncbi:MAG: hypothetical protein SFU27_00055 [Thermonemataceae bacterium]|nr:hypothetical protein [Thermonemataceae bacterium]